MMTYQEARNWLDQVAKAGNLLGLGPVKALMQELGNPQDQLKFIHIAGTNGKGSVLAFVSTVLQEAGYRTGRYCSPSLFSYREKIQVNQEDISREAVARLTGQIREAVGQMEAKGQELPTIFEVETAMAFLYFQEQHCDYVVLETGMGGDTDATNVVRTSVVEILVSISLDHTEFLGNTLAEIAGHKAGIIKPGTRVVTTLQEEDAMEVIREKARAEGAHLTVADYRKAEAVRYGVEEQRFSYGGYLDLVIHLGGVWQIRNAVTAVEAVKALRESGCRISDSQLRAGLSRTIWRGRMTVLRKNPLMIMDGAHNPAGAEALRATLDACLAGQRIFGICGVFRDKEYRKVLAQICPCLCELTAIQTPDNPRALPAGELAGAAKEYLSAVHAETDIFTAVEENLKKATTENGIVLAFGSLSFLGEIERCCRLLQAHESTAF